MRTHRDVHVHVDVLTSVANCAVLNASCHVLLSFKSVYRRGKENNIIVDRNC